jgi:hypothetical protein
LNPYMGSLKSLRYENQIEPFLKYPLGSMFGKICFTLGTLYAHAVGTGEFSYQGVGLPAGGGKKPLFIHW